MREIKFRAWVEEMVDVKVIDWRGDTYMPKPGIMDQRNDLYFFEDYPDMLMQYTGLKDKNGVEIYEGDILDPELPDGSGAYRIEWTDHGWNTYQDHGFLGYSTSSEHMVVGNIHENKELLK